MMAANHYPDGLAPEDIAALQRAVDDELRREGHPVQERPEPSFLPTIPRRARRRSTSRASRRPDTSAPSTQHRRVAPSADRDRRRTPANGRTTRTTANGHAWPWPTVSPTQAPGHEHRTPELA
ncbi:hypothetical protein Atai01_83050 [Amycolatopsis taiwanensis]|uniref:Uncharacterized protein n=1 Tax=Amycolatopsis taiwanensis TaxID=342230 RepID=A0A9W6R9F2_9PSEU|nr:hypothetical protein Atai01_83050 [Amycolatopsis taiwanensis]